MRPALNQLVPLRPGDWRQRPAAGPDLRIREHQLSPAAWNRLSCRLELPPAQRRPPALTQQAARHWLGPGLLNPGARQRLPRLGRTNQQCPVQGRSGLRQHGRKPWIPSQQRHAALQRQHHQPCLPLEQPVECLAVIQGQQLPPQARQWIIPIELIGEVHHPAGTGGQDDALLESRIEQHVPAAAGSPQPGLSATRDHHPGTDSRRQNLSGPLCGKGRQKRTGLGIEPPGSGGAPRACS